MTLRIPFNKPFIVGKELFYISQAVLGGQLAGDGQFTRRCNALLEEKLKAKKVLLTTSCTHALEMSAILAGIGPGDEVLMPSYTFVSTANAFVLRGAVPVFIDIRPDTLNIDESLLEAAITDRTKAICPVHYAGVACAMDEMMDLARRHGLAVIEDAAQGLNATQDGRHLGTIGELGCLSFHETKNCICGEGGALLVNDESLLERAEIIREKGTNRSQFFRGQVDKYTWMDVGSSYLPSEVVAAFLFAQLEEMNRIDAKRIEIYDRYRKGLEDLANAGRLQLPHVPNGCDHNAHMFYVLLENEETRVAFSKWMRERGISAVHHYVPLHDSPFGKTCGREGSSMSVTEDIWKRLVRLPMYYELQTTQQAEVLDAVHEFFDSHPTSST